MVIEPEAFGQEEPLGSERYSRISFMVLLLRPCASGNHKRSSHASREKKKIIICYSYDSVSPRSFRMNPDHYCSAGPTPRGGPLLSGKLDLKPPKSPKYCPNNFFVTEDENAQNDTNPSFCLKNSIQDPKSHN
ncbi:hypothetical protein YC2023_083831 [Brassica napus]